MNRTAPSASLHVDVPTQIQGTRHCPWRGLKGLPEWRGMEEEEQEEESNGSKNMAEHLHKETAASS